MYSDAELDQAVAAGALSAEAAAGLRAFAAKNRAAPDEEQFRLLTGFNDIFVSIALMVFLIAAAWLGARASVWVGGVLVTGLSWALAEYFTRQRRMALPSIVLALGYAGGCACLVTGLLVFSLFRTRPDFNVGSLSIVLVLLGVTAAVYVHWRRFMVPISFAVGACNAVAALLMLLLAVFPGLRAHAQPLLFAGGLSLFALAMYWDVSDPLRATRRTDTAFWLHLAAAPLIVHAAFGASVVFRMDGGAPPRAALIILVYLLMTLIALVIDRRALLTAALAYVLYAMSVIIRGAGSPALSFALSGLVIGASLLLLSAFWHKARAAVVPRLPGGWQRYLPPAALG